MLPSVTYSGRKAIVATVCNLRNAHCAAVGRNVTGGGFVVSEACSAIGLTSFGTTARPSKTSTTTPARIATCHHHEGERRGEGADISVMFCGTSGPPVPEDQPAPRFSSSRAGVR
jgi:hypothetical protein